MFADFQVGSDHTHVTLDQENEFDSGDLLLFSGKKSFFSHLIRVVQSPTPWTHVAMIIREPKTDQIFVLQSTFENTPANHFSTDGSLELLSPKEAQLKRGVKMTPIGEVFSQYDGYAIAIRKLAHENRYKKDFQILFWKWFELFWLEHGHKSYEQNYTELLHGAYSSNQRSNTDSFFCTELIAEFLMFIGLLDRFTNMISNNFNLIHFQSTTKLELMPPGRYKYLQEEYFHHKFPCRGNSNE